MSKKDKDFSKGEVIIRFPITEKDNIMGLYNGGLYKNAIFGFYEFLHDIIDHESCHKKEERDHAEWCKEHLEETFYHWWNLPLKEEKKK